MSRPRAFLELFAGTASVTLRLLGCAQPPIGYMGSKRRLAPDILAAMGLNAGQSADAVVLVDAGPWGDVWTTLLAGGWRRVADRLRDWSDEDASDLWHQLASEQRPADATDRAAAFLVLQAGSAMLRAVGWSGAGWATHGYAHLSALAVEKGFRSRVLVGLVADRLESAGAVGWPRALSLSAHPAPADIAAWLGSDDLSGVVAYLDPPYRGTTGYAVDCPRDEVVRLATAYRDAGALVVVSEAEALPELSDWWAVDITPPRSSTGRVAKPEWLTMSAEPAAVPGRALSLWGAA